MAKHYKNKKEGFQMNPETKAVTYMAGNPAFSLKPIPAGDKGKGLRKMAGSEEGANQVKKFGYDPATAMKPASYMANLDNARNEKGVITPSAMKMISGSLLSKQISGVKESIGKLNQSKYLNLQSKYTQADVNSQGVRSGSQRGNIVSKSGEVFDKDLNRNVNTYSNFDSKSGEASGILSESGSVEKPSSRQLKQYRSGQRYLLNNEAQYYLNFDPKKGYSSKASLGIEYQKSPSGIPQTATVTNPYSPYAGKVYNLRLSNDRAALANAELNAARKRDNYLSEFQSNFNLYDNMMSGTYKGHLNNPQDNYSGEYGNILKKRHQDQDNQFAKITGAVGSDKFNQKLSIANRKNMPNLFEDGVAIPKFRK